LEKDPARRFSSAAELWNAFEQSIPRHAAPPVVQKVQAEQTVPKPSTPTMQSTSVGKNTASGRKQNALLWVFVSAIILFVGGFAVINSGNSFPIPTPAAVTIVPMQPDTKTPVTLSNFSARPYNKAIDSEVSILWDKVPTYSEITSPGHGSWELDISSGEILQINMVWCATDETTLAANLMNLEFYMTMDDIQISDAQLNIFNGKYKDQYCHYRMGILSELSQGAHKYMETMRLKSALSDGAGIYEAGEYIYELALNVR
jgi:hypothetical protein